MLSDLVAASSLYVFSTAMSFSGPLWGWLADRVSLKLVLGVRAIGNVFSSLVWLLFPSYAGLVIGKVADDAGKAAFRPAWGAVMAKVAALDPARRTRTLAIMSTAEDAGEFGAPILAGVIWTTFDPDLARMYDEDEVVRKVINIEDRKSVV